MVFAVLVVALVGGGTMPMAHYGAKSDIVDDKSPGGYAVSENRSWSAKEVDVKPKALEFAIKKNACCGTTPGNCPMILVLSNGTNDAIWFPAQDGQIAVVREALDNDGKWKPIEYRLQSTCGNSYHRVALSPGRAWTWDIPATSGSFKTNSRYALYGSIKPIYSPEMDCQIEPTVFLLPEAYSQYKMSPDGGLLTKS